MKLQKKLILIFIAALACSSGVSGIVILNAAKAGSVDAAVTGYQQQLESVSLAFEQFTYRQEMESMSEAVRESYIGMIIRTPRF